MRVSVGNQQFEVRIQERKVTIVDIMQGGRRLSRGMAIQNPKDEAEGQIDLKAGIQIAAARATMGLTLKPIVAVFLAQKILRQFESGIERRKKKAYTGQPRSHQVPSKHGRRFPLPSPHHRK